jgi:energy-coupling factor transporter transmembrane protein EcfT
MDVSWVAIPVVILWIIFAFACMAIAGAKGYSRLSWLFIGFVLGILGLIIIACFPSRESTKDINTGPKYRGL